MLDLHSPAITDPFSKFGKVIRVLFRPTALDSVIADFLVFEGNRLLMQRLE